jgi:carbon monoxide dehydrogenase subunit G
VTIEREPADVFGYMADPSKDTSWRSHLLASQIDGGEMALGSIVHQRYSYQGRTFEAELEVTEYAPAEHLGFRLRGKLRARILFTCVPEAGGTRVNMSGTVELNGAAAFFEGRIQRELDQVISTDLKRLKTVLERTEAS